MTEKPSSIPRILQNLPIWIKVLFSISTIIFVFILWLLSEIFFEKPPAFFPLNDPKAEYQITKNCPNGQGWVEQIENPGYAYCLEYKGNKVMPLEGEQNINFFRVTIGKSNINLDPYLGKKVKNIEGKFVSSPKQCIQEKCIDIGGSWIVLNIDNLKIAE